MTESMPIQLEVETRFAGASAWQKSTIRMYDNGVITGHDAQGSSIGTINFDSYMGPDVIKKCRKPSKLGMLKTSFDRKNRYDFVKDGKVVLSINFNFPTGNEGSFRRMLSNFPERKHACLSGGRKRKSRKAKKTRKRKNRRRKTRKNKRKRKRGGFKFPNIMKKNKTEKKQTNVEMSSVDPRVLFRELKGEYNARDRYASGNADPKYLATGMTITATKINELEKKVKAKYGYEKLEKIRADYIKSVCEDGPATQTNYGVIDCTGQSGGKRRRRKRKTRKAKKSRKSKKRRKSHKRRRR